MASIIVRLFGEDLTASKSLEHFAGVAETTSKRFSKSFGETPKRIAEVGLAAAVGSTYLAANFQTATTRLVTDAGESARALGGVRDGVLDLAGKVGQTPVELARGLYTVESAGYHGAAGLKVLQAAAEGAADGGADLKTVSDALTTTLTDYGLGADKSADVTSKLVETVSLGKTNMEDLAGSLHSVLPGAEAAHLGLSQVLGAMATMTGEGISADQASENLNHAILSLQNPSHVQTQAFAAMGLSSIDVAQNLGKRGLTGTYELLSDAITKHMGPDGLVVQNAMNQSKQAAASADAMFQRLPSSIQGLAKAYQDGSISQHGWTQELKAQTPANANLLRQWSNSENAAHGFSEALKSGQGPFSTYAAELSKLTGGQTGLQVALHLSGDHAKTFEDNTRAIGGATSEAGGHVRGYAAIQANLNQQLKDSEAGVAVVGTRIGTALIPMVTQVLKWTQQWGGALAANQPLLTALAVGIGSIVAVGAGLFVIGKAIELFSVAAKIATGVQWLWNLAMDANPIGIVIVAIGLLVAAIVLVATHWKEVCAFLTTVWAGVVTWLADTWKTIVADLKAGVKFAITALVDFLLWPVLLVTHWGQITGFLADLWKNVIAGISAFVGNAIAWFQGLPTRIILALGQANQWLFNIGAQVIMGLINGVQSMIGAVGHVVAGVANTAIDAAKNALGIHSPSVVFHELGRFTTQGFADGIRSGIPDHVATAMSDLTAKVQDGYTALKTASDTAWRKTATDRKAVASEDRKQAALERDRANAEDALHAAKTSRQKRDAQRRVQTIDDEIAANRKNRAARVQDLGVQAGEIAADGTVKQRAAREKAVLAQIAGVNSQMDRLATERATVADRMKTAQDALTAAVKTRTDFAASMQSGAVGLGALTGATATGPALTDWTGSTTTAALSWQDEVAHLQSALSGTNQARTTFQQLQRLGLNQQSYTELVKQFQQNGDLNAATALLSGGQDAVSQVNSLEGQLSDAGGQLGDDTSHTLYDAGVNAAQGVVDGLNKANDQLTAQMDALGAALAAAVQRELSASYAPGKGGKSGGVHVGAINVTTDGMSTDQLLSSLDWLAHTSV